MGQKAEVITKNHPKVLHKFYRELMLFKWPKYRIYTTYFNDVAS